MITNTVNIEDTQTILGAARKACWRLFNQKDVHVNREAAHAITAHRHEPEGEAFAVRVRTRVAAGATVENAIDAELRAPGGAV